MKSKCINPNNNIILELAEQLDKSKYETAIDVEIWQENNNTSKTPTVSDLNMPSFAKNENGKVTKIESSDDLIDWMKQEKIITKKTKEGNYLLKVRENEGLFKIYSKEQVNELPSIKAKNIKKIKSINDKFKTVYNTTLEIINFNAASKGLVVFNPKALLLLNNPKLNFSLENEIEDTSTFEDNKFKNFIGSNIFDSKTALQKIASLDTAMGKIAKNLFRSDLNIEIEIIDVDYFDKNNLPTGTFNKDLGDDFKGAGFYNPGNRKIYIARGAKSETSALLIHEILHAQTFHYIHNNPNSSAVKHLEKMLLDLKKRAAAGEIKTTYPLTNIDELLTGIFTNISFVNELKNILSKNKNFKSVWDEILQLFKTIFKIENISILDEVFAYSSQIVEESIDSYNNDKEMSESFYETLFSKEEVFEKQNEIINQLDNLQTKVTKVDEKYKIEGFVQEWIRASTVAKKKIQERTFNPPSEEDAEKFNMYTQAGTIIHAIQANYIKKMFPEANKHLADTVIPIELKDLEFAIQEQLKPHVKLAKEKGSVIKAEVFIANAKTGIAGTIDLLEITKDGKYIIYDLKTRFTKDETALRRFNKINEWSNQTFEYKKILEEGDNSLGIIAGEVEGVYILELEVTPSKDGVFVSSKVSANNLNVEQRATKFLKYRKLNKIKVVAPFFLRTKEIKLDLMIDSLMAQIEKIKALKPKTDIEKQAKENLFDSKLELMQALQLKKDINLLIENAYNDLTQIEKLIENKDLGESEQVVKEQIELYSNILEYVENVPKEMEERLEKIQILALKLNIKYRDLGKEVIIKAANSTGFAATLKEFGKDLFGAVVDVGVFRKLTMGISSIDNPLVQNAFKATMEATAKARAKAQLLADKVIEVRKKLVEQLGKADFETMINYNKNKEPVLVQEFSVDFYTAKKAADKSNDIEWLTENVNYDQQHYLEARERQLDYFDAYRDTHKKSLAYQNPELTDAELEIALTQQNKLKMNKWESQNKGSLILHFKPKVQWRDSKWVDIKMGKYKGTAVEEFYDLYFQTLELARELQPDQVHKNFIPNFAKSFIDKTMQDGLTGAIKGKWSGLFDTLELDYDRETYSSTDSVTGEIIHTMYIPGTSKQNAKDKSIDLAAGLFMFMEGVYRYNELKDVEQMVLATKKYLKNETQFVKKDALGRIIEGKLPTVDQNSNSLEMYSSWIDGLFYGIKTKNETAFEIKGNGFTELFGLLGKGETKKISYAKIVDKILAYTSIRNLGFNIYAPIVNLLSGSANMYMTGAGGVHYSNKDMSKALSLILGGKTNFPNAEVEKARLIVDWLQVDTSEYKKNVEEELSSYKIKRLAAKYNMMSIMGLSEGVLRDSGAIAMVLSGKHKYNWEDFTVVDGKLVIETDILSKEVFRQKVISVNQTNIGGINPDDMMMAKQYIVGRILMQHRSWLPALALNRFGGKQFDYNLGKDIEGRYMTAFRLFKYLTFQKNIRDLSEMEQANLKAARIEVAMILGTGLLLTFMKAGFDDDDKKEAWYKITKKINSRVFSELIFFADPTFQNQYQILLSPAASAGTIEDVAKFLGSSFEELTESDPKKLEKNKPGQKALKLIPGSKVYTFIEDLTEEEK